MTRPTDSRAEQLLNDGAGETHPSEPRSGGDEACVSAHPGRFASAVAGRCWVGHGALLAIEEINASGGVLGRPIEPVIYDPASDPKKSRSCAERLFKVDKIRLLFGCYMSSTRKAVLPVAEAYRGLLFYPTLYEGFEYSRHCVYTGAAPNQNSLPLAKFLLSTFGNRFLFGRSF